MASNQVLSDYLGYFPNNPLGSVIDWAGGTLTRTDEGATYQNPGTGENAFLTTGSDINQLALDNPSIANAWNANYGFSPSTSPEVDLFQPDLYPTSSSSSSTRSSNSSGGSSNSFSGINWNNPLMQSISGQLQSSINNIPTLLDNYSRTLQDQQKSLATQMLGPGAFQGVLNNLARKNILNSSVAGDAMSGAAKTIMQDLLNSGYQSNLAAQQARLNLPTMLAGLAELGQQATSSSRNSSSGTSVSTQSSSTANPLAPYELLSNHLLGLQ